MASVKFGQRQVANDVRNRLDGFLDEDDDRRSTTVKLQGRVPDSLIQRVREEAADSREAEAQKSGQAGLSDRDRKEIDFSKDGVNVPFARSVKGIADSEGVEDWLQFADFSLTVDENRNVLERAGREERGARGRGRTDERTQLQKGKQAKRQRRQQAETAKQPAFEGDTDAVEFLREEERFEDNLFDVSLRGSGPSGSDFERLQEAHENRSDRARYVDERRSAKVTRDPLLWAQNKSQYDYPGIDTVQPAKLHAERSKRARRVDEEEQAPIADSREQWARHSDQYDWPGVDTKQRPSMNDIRDDFEAMRGAKKDALYRYEPTGAAEDARAAGVPVNPGEEQRDSMVADGLGGVAFDRHTGGFRETDRPELDERPPDFARGEDPFDMSDSGGLLADVRGGQSSLDVGRAAGVTEDRSGKIAGSAGFEDRRDELRGSSDPGEQTGLFEQETTVGDGGQTDLFGERATESSGGEFRI